MIELNHINKSYGTSKVLDGLNLQIHSGEIHVLMGDNGAGKTTLTRILAGLEQPDSGTLSGPGSATKDCRIMIMQQDFVIWPELTVSQNMSVAAKKKDAAHWLQTTRLSQLSKTTAGKLSHGQKQRLSIARAMAFKPRLLIIDEAFSYLDPIQSREAQKWVMDALSNPTNPLESILWITQSPQEAMAVANRMSIIERGQILATSSPKDIYLHPHTLNAARLTGSLSIISHTDWQQIQKFATLPKGSPSPKATEVLAFRPEWVQLVACSSDEMGLTVQHSHFHPHGYHTDLKISGSAHIQVHTQNLPNPDLTYQLSFKRPPCLFTAS